MAQGRILRPCGCAGTARVLGFAPEERRTLDVHAAAHGAGEGSAAGGSAAQRWAPPRDHIATRRAHGQLWFGGRGLGRCVWLFRRDHPSPGGWLFEVEPVAAAGGCRDRKHRHLRAAVCWGKADPDSLVSFLREAWWCNRR